MSGHNGENGHVDWDAVGAHLEASGELQLPALNQIADRLRGLTAARTVQRVLDVGAGPGVMSCVLAEAFPDADVVAVDGSPELLERVASRAERLGLGTRVTTSHLLLPDGLDAGSGIEQADLVWTSKTIHHLGDQQAALVAIASRLAPGGMLAVAEGGLPMRFLPRDIGQGRPGLQARLDAAQEQWFELMRSQTPGAIGVVEDWPAMLRRAGMDEVAPFTMLLDLPAPLDAEPREFLRSHLQRIRDRMSDWLDAEDRTTLDALLDPGSPTGMAWRQDAFLLSATTVITATRRP